MKVYYWRYTAEIDDETDKRGMLHVPCLGEKNI